jgi:nucleotide-binding universal stress UspA family protein
MYSKILLPVNLNEESSWEKALPTALTLCRSFGASLHVVTVLPDYRMPLVGSYFPKDFTSKAHEAISEAQHKFIQENVPEDIQVQSVIVDGSPWEAIIKAAKKL